MRIPFNILDEAFVHIDDPTQPLTVQIEAHVDSRLECDRLRAALGAAAAQHPMARARVLPWHGGDPYPEWHIDDDVQLDTLQVVAVDDDGAIDTVRGDLLSTPISLYESPPWRARLIHAPAGDVVLLSVHHSASDGMGCLRFLQSVLRAYADADDPIPDLDPVVAHSLDFADSPSRAQRGKAAALELRKLRHVGSPPARVAPDGAADLAGYGIVTRRVPADLAVGSAVRQRLGASVNDLLLAAHHLTIDRWNTSHDLDTGRVAIHMPINARPERWKHEVVGNLVFGETVSTTPAQRTTPATCLGAVAGWTEAIKARGPEPAMAALAALPRLSIGLKRFAIVGATNLGSRMADSSVLSNTGRIRPDFVDSKALHVEEVLFSPPTAMPLGVGLGAAATDQWLSLSFRHRPTLLDRPAATAFADLYIGTLEELARTEET